MRSSKRFIVAVVVVTVLLAAGGVVLWCRPRPSGPRHVILISIDTCRADVLSCYGCDRQTTPHIDALAEQATLFENAISPVPITLPSHCSMLTGTIPPYHGVRSNMAYRLMPTNQTLAESLQASGYATGAVVSAFVLDGRYGLDQGFDDYDDTFRPEPDGRRPNERGAAETAEVAIEWLRDHVDQEKLFLFLHYYDPHLPYQPPPAFLDRFGSTQWDRYAGEVAYVDQQIGVVLKELKRLGLYDDAMIIITADHGEMMGEHGEMGHQFFIYQSAVRVPLIVKLPGQLAGRRVKEVVGLVDVLPTVCSFAGVETPASLDGRDLSAYLTDQPAPADGRPYYCESIVPRRYNANELWGLVEAGWKFIETTRPELYDLRQDPAEARNLYNQHEGRARAMEDRLKDIFASRSRNLLPSPVQISREARQRLESLGYVGFGYDTSQPEGATTFNRSRQDPKDVVSYHSRFQQAVAWKETGQYDQALELGRELVIERDDVFTVQIFLARLLSSTAQHLDDPEARLAESLGHYNAAIELNSADSSAFAFRGVVRELLGDREGAQADYSHVIDSQPTVAENYVRRAMLLGGMKRWDDALNDLRQAAQLDPEDERAKTMRARLSAFRTKWQDALAQTSRAIEANPTEVGLYVRRAISLDQLGRTDDALADCNRAVSLLPPGADRQRTKIEQLAQIIR